MRPLSFSLSLLLALFLARPATAAITLKGEDPTTGFTFYATTDVFDTAAPSDPLAVDPADFSHPLITNDIVSVHSFDAIFEFAMVGPNGETFEMYRLLSSVVGGRDARFVGAGSGLR